MNKRVVVGAVIAVAGVLSVRPAGQGRGGAERPKIARIERVRDNLYWITEGTGAAGASNLAVFVTGDGVVLVDTKNPGWGAEIQRLIGTVTDKPVTTIINTHTHRDHTGSNQEFSAGVRFIVQENTRANLSKDVCEPIANCGFLSGEKTRYLPKTTFTDRMRLGDGKDRVELYNFGPAHTSGDAIVVFPAARTAHFADLFARKTLPNIMTTDGGTILGHLHTLEQAVATIKGVDTVITGHSTSLMSWADLEEFVRMNHDFVMAAQEGLRARRKADDVAAEITKMLTAKYPGYAIVLSKAQENVSLVYDEIYRSGHYVR
ncbi:MAG TPA: MBL fold metallo-hydrolase [Vicinamibacterales bacterium]|nr:MBL fold metallo-hydrolase [Vicinamibacterales bacterium]